VKLLLALIVLNLNYAFGVEIIVRLKTAATGENLPRGFELKETLIKDLNIYLLEGEQWQRVKSNHNILSTLKNEKMVLRENIPNDPDFSQLWGMTMIQAPSAWSMAVGDTSNNNDQIVAALIDSGVDTNHIDLKNNLWVNKNEIPGNNLDDDGNGYIDDINGWDPFSGSGKIPTSAHGTHVFGIMGAMGNNKKFVTGVNWNLKVMVISGASMSTSMVVKAYGYVLAQKKLFLKSSKKLGSNIVVANSSFGVDQVNCQSEDYRLWNDIYNELGKVGILSVVATANGAWDVDVSGDVPSACESEFIIGVTNTTRTDSLNPFAAWGKANVDLAARGTDIVSTVPGNQIGSKTGTSMSTPHVAGTVALLYSVTGSEFGRLSPANKAMKIKSVILESVDHIKSLQGKTLSEGRLNLRSAVEKASKL